MGRTIGYVRVSTNEQDLSLQMDALIEAGCSKSLIFQDKVSGAKSERPGLDKCLAELKENDTLLVWRLDRLGRSMMHLVGLVQSLFKRNIGFKSLCDGAIDTTTASGELIFTIFSAMAQFERRLIEERTRAGLTSARARGRVGGRPPLSLDDPKVITVRKLYKDNNIPINDICKTLKISRPTFFRYVKNS